MNVIDAIKRLERAGDENSKATQKLHEAVRMVAKIITNSVPNDVKLPRGYKKIEVKSNVGYSHFLIKCYIEKNEYGEFDAHDYVDGIGGYLHGDFHCEIPPQTRGCSLDFAKDVAEGLLDEIAEFLERRRTESDNAAEVLANIDADC